MKGIAFNGSPLKKGNKSFLINYFFLINQMIVPGSCYWNLGIGLEAGDVKTDEEGVQTMKTLGRNMAWLLDKIKG